MSQVSEVGVTPTERPAVEPPAKRRRWMAVVASVVTGALLFVVGAVGGFTAASQKSMPLDAHGHSHGGDASAPGHAHAPKLSPQTLANLGVEIGERAAAALAEERIELVPPPQRAGHDLEEQRAVASGGDVGPRALELGGEGRPSAFDCGQYPDGRQTCGGHVTGSGSNRRPVVSREPRMNSAAVNG